MKDAAEATVAGIAQKVALSGGSASVIGGVTANELFAFGGFLVALVGVVIQWYYRRRADRRDAEFHAKRLEDLREYREGREP